MSILKREEEDCGDHVSIRLDRGRSGVDRAGLRSFPLLFLGLALASSRGERVEYGVRRMFLEGNFVDWGKVSSVLLLSFCWSEGIQLVDSSYECCGVSCASCTIAR
jgi:hypothetical protein